MQADQGRSPAGDSQAGGAPSPRAFATATGFALQVVGVVHLLASGGFWFLSGLIQSPVATPVKRPQDYLAAGNIVPALTTFLVLAAFAGGLAMIAFGVGLQGERPRSGVGAMLTTGMLTAVGLAAVVLGLTFGPSWAVAAAGAVVAGINAVFFLLSGQSAGVLKRFPAPPDQNVVDDAWLEEHARRRRSHRGGD